MPSMRAGWTRFLPSKRDYESDYENDYVGDDEGDYESDYESDYCSRLQLGLRDGSERETAQNVKQLDQGAGETTGSSSSF